MNLVPEQRRILRRLVTVSTTMLDLRYALYERRKEKALALQDVKRDIERARYEAETAHRVGDNSLRGEQRDNYAAAKEEKLRMLVELRTDLEKEVLELDAELAALEPHVHAANAVAENVLKHIGLDRELRPAGVLT